MFNQYALRLVACASVATVLFGCSGGSSSSSEPTKEGASATAASGPQLKLAFVTNNAADFWKIAKAGSKKAESELGNVKVDFLFGDMTAGTQQQMIDDLLSKGVDGIAISPVSPKDQISMLDKAAEKAIVVTQDSDAPESKRSCYIGTDNVDAGTKVGKELLKALPNGGDIMIFVGTKDAQNAKDRIAGIEKAIAGSKIKVLDILTDGTDQARAKANVADTLTKHPTIAGLVGIYNYNGPAILSAVKDASKQKKVAIVCFDENADTLQGVRDGDIAATVVQDPYNFGYKSIKTLADLKAGKKDVVPADKKIIVDTKVIDKAGVDEFEKTLKERING